MKTTFTKTIFAAFIAAFAFGQSSNAQIIFSEDFANGIPGTWTTIDNDGLTVNANIAALFPNAWNGNADADNLTDTVAASTSWYTPAGTSDDWLISPPINLTSNNTLAWEEKAQDPLYPDGYELRISTSTPTIAAFNANAPLFTIAAGSGGAWASRSVDLQAMGYSNQTVYLAWRNNSTDMFILDIDDIVVSAPITGGGCDTTASTYVDLNNAGGAPCFDGTTCVPTDPGFTTIGIGVYGSESYILDNVQAGFDYVFDMCSGVGAGSWIPEITIIAADGTTIDATNVASSTSGATHGIQCTLSWTASQSGTYTIMINEMGTSVGDAPNQVDCITTLEVDNGNPTVTCGLNPATCLSCSIAGTLTSALSQDVCPGDTGVIALNGLQSSPGDYSIGFSDVLGGTGGLSGGFTIIGIAYADFPWGFDNDLNGILSFNSLDTLLGTWVLTAYATDPTGANCDSTVTTTINFLGAADPDCNTTISTSDLEVGSVNVYPNPTSGAFTLEMNGVNGIADLTVLDTRGRMVYRESVISGPSFRKNLDLNLSEGSYVIRITTETDVLTQKLTIK